MQDYIDVMPALTECCNTHDYCYDICGIDKSLCDKDFERCVRKLCSRTNLEPSETERANLHQGRSLLSWACWFQLMVNGGHL